MSIIWLNKKQKDGVATINLSSITLNKTALLPLEVANKVMVGINKEEKEIVIKPIDFNKASRGDLDIETLYKITVKSSYARITSKEIISIICDDFNLSFKDGEAKKYKTMWNEKDNVLLIKIDKEVI